MDASPVCIDDVDHNLVLGIKDILFLFNFPGHY